MEADFLPLDVLTTPVIIFITIKGLTLKILKFIMDFTKVNY